MVDYNAEYFAIPFDRTVSLLGLDENGDVANFDIQGDIFAIAAERWEQYPPAAPYSVPDPVDFSIKAKVRTMYAIAASKNRIYKAWGDQSVDTPASGGGTVSLITSDISGDINVIVG